MRVLERLAGCLVVGASFLLSGCHSEKTPAVPKTDGTARASGASVGNQARRGPFHPWLIIGQVIDLGSMATIATVTQFPPEREISSHELDFGAVANRDGTVQGVQLSTGATLWTRTPAGPCHSLAIVERRLYARCALKLVSFDVMDGGMVEVDAHQSVRDIAVSGRYVASLHSGYRNHQVKVFDATTNRQVAVKELAEIREAARQFLLPRPGAPGFCVLGLHWPRTSGHPVGHNAASYRAGCYDDHLSRAWSVRLPEPGPADYAFDLRSLGPNTLILDDQSRPFESEIPARQGRGLLMSWRDGTTIAFFDRTFVSIEDQSGERVSAPDLVRTLWRVPELEGPRTRFAYRSADVAVDGRRAFALIRNDRTALAGFDLDSKRTVFLVGVIVGGFEPLEVVAGLPIVRSQENHAWSASVHDPETGSVLYKAKRAESR